MHDLRTSVKANAVPDSEVSSACEFLPSGMIKPIVLFGHEPIASQSFGEPLAYGYKVRAALRYT